MDGAGNDGTTGTEAGTHTPPVPPAHLNGAAHDGAGLNGAAPHTAAPAAAAEASATLNAEAAAASAEPAAKSAGKFMTMLKNNKGLAIAAAVVAVGAVVATKHFRGKEEAASRA